MVQWIAFGCFVLFCLVMVLVSFTKPIPPADEKGKEKNNEDHE